MEEIALLLKAIRFAAREYDQRYGKPKNSGDGDVAPLIPLFLPYSALSSPEISELSPSFRSTGSFS